MDDFNNRFNPVWDEFDWESHINEMNRRYEYLRYLIESDHNTNPRWLEHLREFPTKAEAVDAFIEEELLIEESHFPLTDYFEEEEEETEDDLDESEDVDELGDFDDLDDLDELDELDQLDGLNELDELFPDDFEDEESDLHLYSYASMENIVIFTEARDFAADLLLFHDSKPQYFQHPGFIKLISESLMLSSKLAAAYSVGFDLEVLGANIAYCKKALFQANQTLQLLQALKLDPLAESDYDSIHRRLFTIRNNTAIHIQEIRDFFHSQL